MQWEVSSLCPSAAPGPQHILSPLRRKGVTQVALFSVAGPLLGPQCKNVPGRAVSAF